MAFQPSPWKLLTIREKILILFAVLLLTLAFIFLVPEFTIFSLLSPIILAVIFTGLNRRPMQRRLDA